jgi:Ca2+-binding RTX toxin-like protein
MIKGTKRPVVHVLTVSLFSLFVFSATTSQAQPRPRCFGQRATIRAKASGITRGTRGRDVIVGTPGRDVIKAKRGSDLVCGRGGNDVINGARGVDALAGDSGDDTVKGGRGQGDALTGGLGNDVLNGGPGAFPGIAIYSESPNGVAVNLATGSANGRGRDTLINISGIADSRFDDLLTGSAADEQEAFLMRTGNDTIDGGGGEDDIVVYNEAPFPVTIDLAAGTAVGQGINTTMTGIQNAIGSQFDDTITGNDLANFIWGVDGDDTITTGSGDDFIEIPLGNDEVDGGAGVDIAGFLIAGGPVTADLAAGTATVDGTPTETSTLIGIESLIGSFEFGDTLSGSSGPNTIIGVGGSDEIDGLGGDDFLDGDLFGAGFEFSGTDDLDGGDGNDTCVNGEVETNCEADPPPAVLQKTNELGSFMRGTRSLLSLTRALLN